MHQSDSIRRMVGEDTLQMEHLWPHSQVQVSQSYKAATRLPVCGKVFGHRIPGGLGQKSFFLQL